MQDRLGSSVRRVNKTFAGFSGPQRLIAVIGIALLVLGGAAFYRWANEPTMQPLFTNLASSDASAIIEQLDGQGVSYQLRDGGATVVVPQDQVYKLRLSMSAQGLPASKDSGYSLLDQQGVTTSQFQQQVTWQRALEGELATTINSLAGVQSSVVHLALPARDVFSDKSSKPTASVLISLGPGKTMGGEQVQAIVHLVSSSVENLTTQAVTVVDGEGSLLSAAGTGVTGGGLRDQQTVDYEHRVASSLQSVLERVVGAGNAVATVTAELSFDEVNRTSETFAPAEGAPPLTSTTTSEDYTGGGGAVGGVLGPDNIAVPNGAGGSDSSYTKKGSTQTNSVNKVTEQSSQAPGALTRQSVSVVVNSALAGDVDMTSLREAVAAAAGVNPERGDTVSVTRMPFDATGAEQATAATEAAAAAQQRSEIVSLARTGGVILAALILVIIAAVISRRRRARDEMQDLPALEEALDWLPEEEPDVPQREEEPAQPAIEMPTQQSIAQREAVAQLVDSQPAEVAELLRGWLADRRS